MVKIWNNKRDRGLPEGISHERIPDHIAIIMDGNGRWAQQRGLPRALGHRAGVEALRGIVKCCDRIGVKYLTVYAFSTENWKRPQTEIGILMSLLKEYVRRDLDELHANKVRIKVLGDTAKLPEDVAREIELACQKTKQNTGLVFNLALNYGGRAEIIQAVKNLIQDIALEKIRIEDIEEELFEQYLYTRDCPEPELLIRTSGELRLSNFLLWQAAYSEIVVVDHCWPDFNEEYLLDTIRIYQNRERRFGGIKKVEE